MIGKRVFYIVVIIALVTTSFASTGCTEDERSDSARDSTATVGAVLPLTGPASDIGEKARRGLRVAEETLPVEVKISDSRSSPKTGVNAFQSLLSRHQGINAVFSVLSGVGKSIIPIAEDRGVVTMHVASAPDMAAGRSLAFRWYITSEKQMEKLVRYLGREKLDSKKIAFLYINDEYGIGGYKAFVRNADSINANIQVRKIPYQPDQRDFRSIVSKVKNYSPDYVAVVGYSSSLGTLIQQIRQAGVDAQLIGDDAISFPQILSVAGSAANGFLLPGVPINKISKSSEFYKKYSTMYEGSPGDFAVFAYGNVKILSECIVNRGNKKPQNIANCIEEGTFSTPLGKVKFDKDHNGTVNLVMERIRSGETVPIETNK